MKTFSEISQFYVKYHQKPVTLYTHFIGVPLVTLSVMIFLGFIKIIVPGLFATDVAFLTTLVALFFYFRLQWQLALALALTPLLFILLWIAHAFSYAGPTKTGVLAFIITFVLGLGAQLYGHHLEGKKPAFMDNFVQSLIAPLFLVAELFFMAGYMTSLKEQIYAVELEHK